MTAGNIKSVRYFVFHCSACHEMPDILHIFRYRMYLGCWILRHIVV